MAGMQSAPDMSKSVVSCLCKLYNLLLHQAMVCCICLQLLTPSIHAAAVSDRGLHCGAHGQRLTTHSGILPVMLFEHSSSKCLCYMCASRGIPCRNVQPCVLSDAAGWHHYWLHYPGWGNYCCGTASCVDSSRLVGQWLGPHADGVLYGGHLPAGLHEEPACGT